MFYYGLQLGGGTSTQQPMISDSAVHSSLRQEVREKWTPDNAGQPLTIPRLNFNANRFMYTFCSLLRAPSMLPYQELCRCLFCFASGAAVCRECPKNLLRENVLRHCPYEHRSQKVVAAVALPSMGEPVRHTMTMTPISWYDGAMDDVVSENTVYTFYQSTLYHDVHSLPNLHCAHKRQSLRFQRFANCVWVDVTSPHACFPHNRCLMSTMSTHSKNKTFAQCWRLLPVSVFC